MADAWTELARSVHAALETYANVHRGSGHASQVSTHLYEQARQIILEHLGLSEDKHAVVFCSPRRAELFKASLAPNSYRILSSQEIGLPLGVRALAVERRALPSSVPYQTGGGTARLVSPGWVIWAHAPDRFEAGTPAIVNVIAFAAALRLLRRFGQDAFRQVTAEQRTAAGIVHQDDLDPYGGRELLGALRQTLIGRSLLVETTTGSRPFINLDNAASTPTFTPIWDAVWQTWRQNPATQREIVREVRAICADVLAAPQTDYDVLFTCNTTEAINLVAESLRHETEPDVAPVVLNTYLEHNSNELPWRSTPGLALLRLPVDAEGFIDLRELEALLRAYNLEGQRGKQRVRLVAVSGASNVLGTFNDLAEISRIVHRYGARLLVDAAQLVAHRKVDMAGCGIDCLAFSAHKVYAPFGAGALVVRKGLLRFSAAESEVIRSSGEENVGGIAALGKALVLLRRIGMDVILAEEQTLTARALRGLAQIQGVSIYGISDPDSSRFVHRGGVIAFNMGRILPGQVAQALAERGGIGVRYGCHCAHLLIKRLVNVPPILEQFQGLLLTLFPRLNLPGVVRVSLGIENNEAEIDELLRVLGQIARQPGSETGQMAQKQMSHFVTSTARKVYAPLLPLD
jgi:selenocysteine lyase/cysteine desulfurase